MNQAKRKPKLLRCAAQDCKEWFLPKRKSQLYHSTVCGNREKQRRLRARYREMLKLKK